MGWKSFSPNIAAYLSPRETDVLCDSNVTPILIHERHQLGLPHTWTTWRTSLFQKQLMWVFSWFAISMVKVTAKVEETKPSRLKLGNVSIIVKRNRCWLLVGKETNWDLWCRLEHIIRPNIHPDFQSVRGHLSGKPVGLSWTKIF